MWPVAWSQGCSQNWPPCCRKEFLLHRIDVFPFVKVSMDLGVINRWLRKQLITEKPMPYITFLKKCERKMYRRAMEISKTFNNCTFKKRLPFSSMCKGKWQLTHKYLTFELWTLAIGPCSLLTYWVHFLQRPIFRCWNCTTISRPLSGWNNLSYCRKRKTLLSLPPTTTG